MKTKIVIWGTNDKDERVLIALQLRAKDNKVDLFTFPETLVSETFYNQMMEDWRLDKECPFPEGHQKEERNLSATEGLLPETLKVERGDLVQRAQTEWHFVVLSSKLNETYHSELESLKGKIEGLTAFESAKWDELKTFWDKVQNQIQERNLFREHANALRESTNGLFDHLKKLRSSLDDEFKVQSKTFYDQFMTTLNGVDDKVAKGLNLQSVFNELRNIQNQFKDSKLTREHRSKVWNKMDKLFKVVKAKRFGEDAASGNSPMDRLKKRYDGLMNAIGRMENSIRRDNSDLEFQNKRIADTEGQLEAQIRAAKLKMIEERINSKNEKLEDMLKTKGELESKMASQEERDKRNAEKAKEKAAQELAKAEAKKKIAAKIAEEKLTREVDAKDLTKAAEAIAGGKAKPAVVVPPIVLPTEEVPVATIAEVPAVVEAPTEVPAVEIPVELPVVKTPVETPAVIEPALETPVEAIVETPVTLETPATEKAVEEPTIMESAETLMGAVSVTLSEAIEDVVDTVKAVAEVVSDKVGDAIEDLKEVAAEEETPKGAKAAGEEE